jgi:hypothetical protein
MGDPKRAALGEKWIMKDRRSWGVLLSRHVIYIIALLKQLRN